MNQKTTGSTYTPSAKMVRLGDGAYISAVILGQSLKITEAENPVAFTTALAAYRAADWEGLYTAMRPVKAFVSKMDGVTVDGSGVYFGGEQVHTVVADRIMDFALNGLDHSPLCAFLNKLMKNPSRRAVQELYTFLEHKNLPITDNGNFLAYKGVKADFYSCTSGSAKLIQGKANAIGSIYNGIGEVIEIARNEVDDNKEQHCSYGLHAGTAEYALGFARGKTLIVEIDPADVVSIPSDCSCQKLRTCKYKVVDEFKGALTASLYESKWDDVDELEAVDPDFSFTPNSSWITSVEYYANGGKLILNTTNRTITHVGVEWNVAEDFEGVVANGGSAGEYYNDNVKDNYPLAK